MWAGLKCDAIPVSDKVHCLDSKMVFKCVAAGCLNIPSSGISLYLFTKYSSLKSEWEKGVGSSLLAMDQDEQTYNSSANSYSLVLVY